MTSPIPVADKPTADRGVRFRLDGGFDGSTGEPAEVSGSHRFVEIAGRVGYQPLALETSLEIPSTQHLENEGTFVLWISPLESLGVSPPLAHVDALDPNWHNFGLLADTPRTNNIESTTFAWYWRADWHPQMIAKFKSGVAGNAAADFSVTPYVPVEHLPLHARHWYQLAFTYNKEQSRFRIYVNGILCGTTRFPFLCDTPGQKLFLGNTAMVFADLEIFPSELSEGDVQSLYRRSGAVDNDVDDELLELFSERPRAAVDWSPSAEWTTRYSSSLTHRGDFDGWTQEGCLTPEFRLTQFDVTADGLLIETPDVVDTESRVYFWSPESFDGDLAVEYEFRPESETGLALLIAQASGMQREDILDDQPPRTTGAMTTIIGDRIRNYHWEYYRKAVDVRGDLGTQVLVKNPWFKPLGMSTRAPLEVGTWHRLLFLQEGNRIRAGLDGEWVLDVTDDAFAHSGPVLNHGRVGLRLMYSTRMRFRDLTIRNRRLD